MSVCAIAIGWFIFLDMISISTTVNFFTVNNFLLSFIVVFYVISVLWIIINLFFIKYINIMVKDFVSEKQGGRQKILKLIKALCLMLTIFVYAWFFIKDIRFILEYLINLTGICLLITGLISRQNFFPMSAIIFSTFLILFFPTSTSLALTFFLWIPSVILALIPFFVLKRNNTLDRIAMVFSLSIFIFYAGISYL